jgi:hypothetical protein
MIKQVITGFTTEGTTDVRFLEGIIQRSFEDVAFECTGQVEILPVQYIKKQSGDDFVEMVRDCAQQADKQGIMVFCVHVDADDVTDTNTFKHKINPAFRTIDRMQEDGICKNLVAVIPVQMTEAWILSDKELLKDEIGTNKSDDELGLNKFPELYTDPKQIIEMVIRIARQDLTKRRRHELTIAELYLPLGQKVELSKLEILPSYRKFKDTVREAFRKLNYLH